VGFREGTVEGLVSALPASAETDLLAPGLGAQLHALCSRLYPIMRSITGDGLRSTLAILAETLPMQVTEVPSGTRVFDWTVPDEWNLREAWIAGPDGRRVVDVAEHTLHIVQYSEPIRTVLTLDALQPHLYSIPERPDWIPYRTSYYQRNWGFCLADRVRRALPEGRYEVNIDATLASGHLTYGEVVIPGESDHEFVVSVHVCHPSLANDNLSGISVASALAAWLSGRRNRWTYRFIFAPSTVGAITWLAQNEARLDRIIGGLVISGVGDAGPFTYKRSRHGDAVVDRVFEGLLAERGAPHTVEPFTPYGYDERQYCSPGVGLPVGCLMRTPFGRYPQYHTSADNLDLVRPESLAATVRLCAEAIERFDAVVTWINLSPKGEPQLGRRGLYDSIGGENDKQAAQMAMLWMLSDSDGRHDTLAIAEKSGLPVDMLDRAARRLQAAELLRPEPVISRRTL
jgi:aminopeptidase-like protein